MKSINPLSDHLKGVVTTTELVRSTPKEGPVPLKKVAGGIIKRIPVNRMAAIVTAPANWMCKPIFEKVNPETVSEELTNCRCQLRKMNDTVQRLMVKLKTKNLECDRLKAENEELRQSLIAAVDACHKNIHTMNVISHELF